MLVSLVTMLAAGHPVAPPAIPASWRYRIDIHSAITIGAKGDSDYYNDVTDGVAFVTLTMSDTTIGRFATFVLDSITYDGGQTAMEIASTRPGLLKNPKGTVVRFLVVDGEMDGSKVRPSITPEDENLPMSSVLPTLPALFPGLRKDIKAGGSWADTSKAEQPGAPPVIATWKVSAGEGDALTYSGSRSAPTHTEAQDSSVMNGTETSTQEIVTSTMGPARRINLTSAMEGIITGGHAGTKGVPIRTTRSLKVTPLT